MPRAELEPEEILKGTRHLRAPRIRGDARQRHTIDQNSTSGGLVHPREQFDEGALPCTILANHGDDGPRGQVDRDVVQREPFAPRIRERDVLEPNAPLESLGRR